MEKKYDLTIAYRIYPRTSKNPAVYPTDKFKLSELCLSSFKEALRGLYAKLIVLVDNCPDEYVELFHKYFNREHLEFYHLPGVGNHATFQLQIEKLLEQNDSEYVYFAEDDYFYLPDSFKDMLLFIKSNPNAHFLTPYNHPDYYNLNFHKGNYSIVSIGNYHWRTVNSTTCTFMTTKSILRQTSWVLLTYSKNHLSDTSIWLSLTKYHVFNPIILIRYLIFRKYMDQNIFRCWTRCWKQLLFGKRWKLWAPIPTIGTHLDKEFLAPGYNWLEIFQNLKPSI